MAITNTRTVQRVEVYPAVSEDTKPRLMVVYEHTFDDTSDADLPVVTTKVKHLEATTTDISGEDQLVQDICNALWV